MLTCQCCFRLLLQIEQVTSSRVRDLEKQLEQERKRADVSTAFAAALRQLHVPLSQLRVHCYSHHIRMFMRCSGHLLVARLHE